MIEIGKLYFCKLSLRPALAVDAKDTIYATPNGTIDEVYLKMYNPQMGVYQYEKFTEGQYEELLDEDMIFEEGVIKFPEIAMA